MDSITVKALLDTTGFTKGSQKLKQAINGIGKSANSVSNSVQKSFNGVVGSAKRLLPMLIGVGSAYGIISKAVSAFMQENQNLTAQMSSAWSSLGSILGPIITQIINWVSTAIAWFIQFLSILGVSTKNSKKAANAAGGAASELKKTIAGFDELNTLSDDSGGGGGGGGKSDFKAEDLPEWLDKLAKALRDKLWDDAADIIIGKFNELIAKFKEKAYEFGKKCGEYFGAAVHIIARTIKEVDWKGIGEAIASFLKGALKEIDPQELGTILVGKFVIMFEILRGFLEDPELLATIATFLSGVVIGALDTLSDEIEKADFQKIGESIRAFFENIDWDGIRESFKTLLKNAVQAAIDFFWGLLDLPGDPPNFWENFSLVNVFKTLRTILVTAAQKAIDYFWKMVGLPGTPEDFWKNVKEGTLSEEFKTKLVGAVQSAIDALWGALNLPGTPPDITGLISGIIEVVGTLSSTISTFVTDVFEGMLKPFLDYSGSGTGISGFISGLSLALSTLNNTLSGSGIADLLSTIWSTLSEMVTATVSTAVTAIPDFIKQLSAGLNGVPTTLAEIVTSLGNLWNNFLLHVVGDIASSGVVEGLLSQVASALTNVPGTIDAIVSALQSLWDNFLSKALGDISSSGAVEKLFTAVITFCSNVAGTVEKAAPLLQSLWDNFLWPLINIAVDAACEALEALARDIENLRAVAAGEKPVMDLLWEHGTWYNDTIENLVGGFGDISMGIHECANEIVRLQNTNLGEGLEPDIVKDFENALDGLKTTLTGDVEAMGLGGEAAEKLKKKIDELKGKYTELAEANADSSLTTEQSAQLEQELLALTQEYVKALAEQGIILDKNGKVVQDTADKIGDAAEKTEDAVEAGEKLNESYGETPAAAEGAGSAAQDTGTDFKEGMETAEGAVEEGSDGIKEEFSTLSDDVGEKSDEIKDKVVGTWKDVDPEVVESITTMVQAISDFVSENGASLEEFSKNVEEEISGMVEDIGRSMDDMVADVTSDFKSMKSNVTTLNNSLISGIKGTWTAAKTTITSNISSINSVAGQYFGQLASDAYIWGGDVIVNLNNGIVAGWNVLEDSIQDVCSMIVQYLGFSEPEKGPLSNFHTFMPDMMKLMADGIRDNIPLAERAVSDVAEAISDEIEDGEFQFSAIEMDKGGSMMDSFSESILEGFADLIAKLEEIAKGVNFTMPTVAGGGFLPYGVSDIGWGDTASEGEEALLEAVDDLGERINDLRDALENMQWVAQFGDLRMLSAEVKRYIKQSERAYG